MIAVAVRETPRRYGAGDCDRPGHRHWQTSDEQPTTGNQPRPSLSEAALARLWAGQRFPAAALVTRQGVPLRVLHPGRPGRGAGPDFRGALLATPSGRLLRGDVELHVRASDFEAHGHQQDRRYDGVALHVVFADDRAEDTLLACGRRAPVVALGDWARCRAQELRVWLSGPHLWREPCHDAGARLGVEGVALTLDELGDRRFGEREAVLAREIAARSPGEALYRALLAALSYGGERERLAAVAEALPWRELTARLAAAGGAERVALAEALLLDAADLPAHQERHTRVPAGRPANHPARRLAGLARLIVRHGPGPAGLALSGPALDAPPRRLLAAWSIPADGSWGGRPGALIGRSRAIELLVNAVLPWLAASAEREGDRELAARARAAFARLPRPARYGALAFLEGNLRQGRAPLRLDARRQQGLLALYKTECTQGGCGRCVFS